MPKNLNIYVDGQDECIQRLADFLMKFQIKMKMDLIGGPMFL